MNDFTVYSKTTGEVIRLGSVPNDIQNQVKDLDEGVASGTYPPLFYYFADDAPVEYTEAEVLLKGIPFFERVGKVWSNTTRTWNETRTAEEILLQQWSGIRTQRDMLLKDCDWTQLPDVPTATRDVWTAYRQALRDITTQTDPLNISWPVAP